MTKYDCTADLKLTVHFCGKWQKESKASLIWMLRRIKQKTFCQEFRLIRLSNRIQFNEAFFSSADCKYGRDNQPNDTVGSATRKRAGGDGGRIIEQAWECISLFSQAFEPIAQDICKSVIAVNEGWLQIRMQSRQAKTCDEQSGMSFAYHSGFTS